MMKKKIYIGCALTHATLEYRDNILRFKDSLRDEFDILDFTGILDGGEVGADKVYEHDRQCVLDSDIFIADCSHPSL